MLKIVQLVKVNRYQSSTSCGIVGYPNVGKSTLFNALTKTQQAQASNYPFCTIEPNMAKVGVYDQQIKDLVKVAKPNKITPAQIEIWDIAGLIKGSSKGAGLGNKFLQNIRQVNAIIHLVRCFKDLSIIYSEGDVNNLDPVIEMEDVQTELILSDLEVCAKKQKKRGNDQKENALWLRVYNQLDKGEPVRSLKFTPDEIPILRTLPLITAKPLVFACNVDAESSSNGNELSQKFIQHINKKYPTIPVVLLSSTLENEFGQINSQEGEQAAKEYMALYGMETSALDKLLFECSNCLGLQKFYTAGPTHVSSWFIKKGSTAPQAAGTIHGGFEKAYIGVEITKVNDWIQYGDEDALRNKNKWQRFGKDYIMQENDVAIFKHNLYQNS